MTFSIRGEHLEAAARDIGKRLSTLQSKDRHRTWRVESVDPNQVHPLAGPEFSAYAAKSDSSLAGLSDYQRLVREGRLMEPLLLHDLGEDGLWLDASTHDLGGSNSLALLVALRGAGNKAHPALVFKEKVEKVVSKKSKGAWGLDPGRREQVRQDLKKQTKALVAGILAIGEDEFYGLALEGGRYGGGITTQAAAHASKKTLEFNRTHAIVFEEYMDDDVDSLVDADDYEDEDDFAAAVGDAFDAYGSRAERYAVAGGNQAWAWGLVAGMIAADTKGGYWNCNFGSGSCPDCMDLHGQYMTAQEFADTYHNTLCDGGCNCGFVPAPGDNPIPFNELEVEEDGAN